MDKGIVYLDESGDQGWTLDKPYRSGGSSRYLTVAAVFCSVEAKSKPKRVIKRLYDKHKWNTGEEKKWSQMSDEERLSFTEHAIRLKEDESSMKYLSMTVRKENVAEHIRRDSNKLYNYMIRLLLCPHLKKCDAAILVPDERSIKVKSGNSLHDYLQTYLWFEQSVATTLTTQPSDSSQSLALQFADMLAGLVNSHFEDSRSDPWKQLSPRMQTEKLFF